MWEDLRKQLYNTVAVGALLVDGDVHASLHDTSDQHSTAYQTLQRALMEVRGRAMAFRLSTSSQRTTGESGSRGSLQFSDGTASRLEYSA